MSEPQDNVQILQRDWVDALREGDVERAIARLAPDVAWQGVESHLVCRDREDVVRWLQGFVARGQPRVERLELTPVAGGVVLSLAGPDFGQVGDALGGELHILFRLCEGEITHMHDYRRREDAVAAATGPPPPIPPREVVADLAPPAPGRARVVGLSPFVHVTDVARSAGFYRLLGFDVRDTYAPGVLLEWAGLEHREARLMLARASEPIDPAQQAILFYLYSDDLAALRRHLISHGVAAGDIRDGTPGPRQEMRVEDPDGYVLMIAQIEESAEP